MMSAMEKATTTEEELLKLKALYRKARRKNKERLASALLALLIVRQK